jgi:hypothetical protein
VLRRALFARAFNPATHQTGPPCESALALGWIARTSLLVSTLDDPGTVRVALSACAKTLAGKPAAGSTQRRKRSVFYNALGYAVELGRLSSNPSTASSGPPYSAVWAESRKTTLTEAQYRSPLGRRPYDLRHAAVSLSLNSGVPATEVARRAGHGVSVLLKIYAHCIDGQADAANHRITDALSTKDTQPEPGGEEDGASKKVT